LLFRGSQIHCGAGKCALEGIIRAEHEA